MDIFNNLVDDAISSLVNDTPEQAADCLIELAKMFADAGQPLSTFENVRKYVILSAEKKSDTLFIQEKLHIIEKTNRGARNGQPINRTERTTH